MTIAERLNNRQHYLRHARETSWPSARRGLMRKAAANTEKDRMEKQALTYETPWPLPRPFVKGDKVHVYSRDLIVIGITDVAYAGVKVIRTKDGRRWEATTGLWLDDLHCHVTYPFPLIRLAYTNHEELPCIGGPLDGLTYKVQVATKIQGQPAMTGLTLPDGSRYELDHSIRSWKYMGNLKLTEPTRLFLEANKGGTCIEITSTGTEDECRVKVGRQCVYELDGRYKVEDVAAALIAGLTKGKDEEGNN